jgi:hypothetical protein
MCVSGQIWGRIPKTTARATTNTAYDGAQPMTPHAFAFERVPEVGGERVLLRELVPSDAEDVFAFSSDPDVQRYNAKPHASLRETLASIAEDRGRYER